MIQKKYVSYQTFNILFTNNTYLEVFNTYFCKINEGVDLRRGDIKYFFTLLFLILWYSIKKIIIDYTINIFAFTL